MLYLPLRTLRVIQGGTNKMSTLSSRHPGCDSCIAVYDLDCSPWTFDFANFLYCASHHFLSLGFNRFKVFIVLPSPRISLYQPWISTQGYTFRSASDTLRRVQALLMPLSSLFPGVANAQVFYTRKDMLKELNIHSRIFPAGYFAHFPLRLPPKLPYNYVYTNGIEDSIQLSDSDLLTAAEYLENIGITHQFVCITDRNQIFTPERNLDYKLLSDLAALITQVGLQSLIIPDKEISSNEYPAGAIIATEAFYNISLRAAIYQLAFFNYFPSTGPVVLAMFNPNVDFCCPLYHSTEKILEYHIKETGYNTALPSPWNTRFRHVASKVNDKRMALRIFSSMLKHKASLYSIHPY